MNNTSADGIVLLAKMPGLTSFASLNNVKKSLNTTKVGHTGTLDSFAQGLLVVCTGRLTKLAGNITEFDKSYTAIIKFGEETDTLEYTGSVIKTTGLPSLEKLQNALLQFKGKILQSPPAFSAIHVDGKRASDMARKGETIEIPKREVTVYDYDLTEVELENGEIVTSSNFNNFSFSKIKYAKIKFSVSKGTYIRSLARDIAYACESSAHLVGLLRTKVGNFTLDNAAGLALLPAFSISKCKQQVTDFYEKKTTELPIMENSIKEHKKYVPTKEDEIIKAEIKEKIQSFSEDCAQLCGFNNVHLVSDAVLDDFLHGRPLRLKSFTEYIDNNETSVLLSVFYKEKFYGLVELAKNKKIYYRFVLN